MKENQVDKVTIAEKIRPVLEAYHAEVELVEVRRDGFLAVRITGVCVSCHDAEKNILEMIETAFKQVICSNIKGITLADPIRRKWINNAVNFLHKDSVKRCRYAITAK